MLKADISNDARTDCALAARRILRRDGVRNQNSEIGCTHGDLIFTRTNGNEIEIRYHGVVVLLDPPREGGSGRQLIWLPADWIHEVDRIDRQVVISRV